MACPNAGCMVQIPRGALAEHLQHCQHGTQQRCTLGCGVTLDPTEHVPHNYHCELREAWGQRQDRSQTLVLCLLQHVRKVHHTTSLICRQLAQLGNFLENDALLLSAQQEDAEATPEGSIGAEVWGVQDQSTL